jgi:hypothetical protein
MAFEPIILEEWIHDTLTADTTLKGYLAIDSKVPGYQKGIYLHIAPDQDPVSNKIPDVPYIVVSHIGNYKVDDIVLCGDVAFTYHQYRVVVWYRQKGSVSYAKLKNIADRVDFLLNNKKVTTTSPNFTTRRLGATNIMDVSADGRIDYGMVLSYEIITV